MDSAQEDKNSNSGIVRYLRDHPPSHYLFKVKPFSLLVKSQKEKHESGVFKAGGYKWKLILYPNGNEVADSKDHISLYLAMADTSSLPHDWEVNIEFKLFVFDQLENKHLTIQDTTKPIKKFHEKKTEWGFTKLLPRETLNDGNKGYLVDDCCIFGAEVFVIQPTERKECLYTVEEPEKGAFSTKLEELSKLLEDCHYSDLLTGEQRKGEVTDQRKLHDKEQGSSLSVLQRLKGSVFSVFQKLSAYKGVPLEGEEYLECELPAFDKCPGILRTIRDLPPAHYLFKIKSFSSLSKQEAEGHESDYFEVGGFKWRMSLYPNGCKKRNGNGHISLYLGITETETLPTNWEVNVNFKLFVFDQIRDKYLTIEDTDGKTRRFHEVKMEWGFDHLLSLDTFNDASNGFLVNDNCIFGAEIFVIRHNCRKEFPRMVKENTNYNTYTWKIDKFSTLQSDFYESEEFNMGGRKWALQLYPKGNGTGKNKCISLYLLLCDKVRSLPPTQEWDTNFKLWIKDQVNSNHHERACNHCFKYPFIEAWGYAELISLADLFDASKGYIKNDVVIIQVIFSFLAKRDILLET